MSDEFYEDPVKMSDALQTYYTNGSASHLNDFMTSVLRIGINLVNTDRRYYYLTMHDLSDDATQYAILSLLRAIAAKKISPEGNLFNCVTSHFRFRFVDYIRKHIADGKDTQSLDEYPQQN